jgi:hypothetical protein
MRLDGATGRAHRFTVMTAEAIEIWRAPECADHVRAATGFGAVVRSNVLPCTLLSCLEVGATIAVARRRDVLCGYATAVPSRSHVYEPWYNLPDVYEIGALEVAAVAPRQGVATRVLEALTRLPTTARSMIIP